MRNNKHFIPFEFDSDKVQEEKKDSEAERSFQDMLKRTHDQKLSVLQALKKNEATIARLLEEARKRSLLEEFCQNGTQPEQKQPMGLQALLYNENVDKE